MPLFVQDTTSLNCHLICSVRCGAMELVPPRGPFATTKDGPVPFAGMSLRNSEYCTTTSFSMDDPANQLWFRLMESKLLVLVAHAEWATFGATPAGCVLWSRAYRSDPNCRGPNDAVALAVSRCSRNSMGKTPSSAGNMPRVLMT